MEPTTNNTSAPRMPSSGLKVNGTGKRTVMTVVAVVVLLALVVVAMLFLKPLISGAGIKGDRYQALFLSNGQVYFGKLSNVDGEYVKLTDIYYLQVQQAVQPADATNSQPKVSLAKLGSELHGPEDEMNVNRSQVLFWENLKEDGKVAQAIKDNKK